MSNMTAEEAIQVIRSNWPDARYTMLPEALEYAITAIEENAKLVKALEWYADDDTHAIKRRIGGDFAPISLDYGKRAKAALSDLRGREEQ